MKKLITGCMMLALVVQTAAALDIGVFASRWNHKDGDAVWGAGVLLLPASLPMEFRGTFYEDTGIGKLQASPLDIGFAFGLTRFESINFSAVGGGSYYFVDAKHHSPDNKFGWYAGGRFEFDIHKNFAMFGEALYRGARLDDADFSGASLNLGLLF